MHADAHIHTPSPSLSLFCSLPLRLSLTLSLPLLYAAILGSGVWNNPRVRMSVCVRVLCVS